MSNRYWENETPITVDTGKNVLRFYPRALRLQVARPDWQDENGQSRMGKAVALDVQALVEAEPEERERAAGVLRELLALLEE